MGEGRRKGWRGFGGGVVLVSVLRSEKRTYCSCHRELDRGSAFARTEKMTYLVIKLCLRIPPLLRSRSHDVEIHLHIDWRMRCQCGEGLTGELVRLVDEFFWWINGAASSGEGSS